MADTCLILFFSGISNALRIPGDANICNVFSIFATRLKHLKRVLNSSNAFETLQRVLNICNAFETFKTCFEYLQRLWNKTSFKSFKRVANIASRVSIFSSAWLCQQSSWNRNLSVVRRSVIISERNARISFKFWLLLPLGHTLGRFLIFFYEMFFVFVNMGPNGRNNLQNATPSNHSWFFPSFF